MISLEKWLILTPLQILPKNVGDLGKLSVAKGFKSCPKSNKSPNLVTLSGMHQLQHRKIPISLQKCNWLSQVSADLLCSVSQPSSNRFVIYWERFFGLFFSELRYFALFKYLMCERNFLCNWDSSLVCLRLSTKRCRWLAWLISHSYEETFGAEFKVFAVWPDLEKEFHFGKNLIVLNTFLIFYLVFCQNFELR